MPSLRKKIYTLLSLFLIMLLILLCTLGYVIFENSVHVDTRNMMTYQGLFIDEKQLEEELSELPRGGLVAAYRDINELPVYIKRGFQWKSMKSNVLYEQELLDSENKEVYVYALIYKLTADRGHLYIISEYQRDIEKKMLYDESLFYENAISVIIAGILLILSTTFLFVLFYHMLLSPIRTVSEWLSKPTEEIPYDKIKYQELITVVQSYKHSIKKQKELIDREELFLSTMSHELRTPIAIISSSVELLERLEVEQKVAKVNERISYAIKNMDYLARTLLWLSRKNNQPLTQTKINLSNVISDVVRDNEYLILGRETQLSIRSILDPEYEISNNYGAIYLVLVNLIRNALQYSANGEILIQHESGNVTIQNPIEKDAQASDVESYGYGLYLVKKICASRQFTFTFSYNSAYATGKVCFEPR